MQTGHVKRIKRQPREIQDELVSAMLEPGFYPKPPAKVEHKETHISHIFLTDDLVYKIKKTVRFPFLDYSTLARRRRFLQEELRLNRRLAPSVYLAVLPISCDSMGWRLGGWAAPGEYALVMRRLPDRRMLPFLLESGQLTPAMMRALAEVLAPFHAQAPRLRRSGPIHYPRAVQKQWSENLAELQPLFGTFCDAEAYGVLKQFGNRFIDCHRDLLTQRFSAGWLREVHGDLHCEHVCFAPEGIQIFDCLEFSPELRCCDLASEVAFLLMDLEARGGGSLVQPFLTRYLELLDDPDLLSLLPFYQCYRALVRGKVEALRSNRPDSRAARYFRWAASMTWEPLKPFAVIVCGLTGSGKSTLARELGERLRMPVISSDAVRKPIAGDDGGAVAPFNQGIYSPAMTKKTYAKMAREAEKQLASGAGVILDATFIHRSHREKIAGLAEKHKVPLFVIHCFASEETIKERLARRAASEKDISDGRWEIYLEQKKLEPREGVSVDWLELNTDSPLDRLAGACERFLRSHIEHAQSER